MPAPTNISAATATDITGLLPYTLNQNVHDAGTTYTVWYKLTPDWEGVLGIWGHGDIVNPPVVYRPSTSCFDNTGVDIYAGIFNYTQRPIQIPVSPGHTIWFRFLTNSGTVTPAQLEGVIQKFAAQTAPAGSIFINDAGSPVYLTALVSPTSGAPLNFAYPIVGGEAMAQLTSGVMLLQDLTNTRSVVYAADFSEVATVAEYPTFISSNRDDLFYIGFGASKPTPGLVKTVNALGVVGGTTWDVGPGISSGAPSRDDAIFYHAEGTAAAPILRWDLPGNLAMSNLAAGVADHTVREIFVLQDNTILVLYRDTSPTSSFFIRHYSAAGATLLDYTSQFSASTGSDPHIALANDDPDSFYVWFKIADGKSRFLNIATATGTVNTTADGWHFSSGLLDASVAAGAPAYFGHSESCTFLITVGSVTPEPVITTEVLIPRRLRRAPHLSNLEVRTRFHRMQVDLQAGVGLVTGQGSDPQLMMRHSNDGGRTWSNEQWASAGAVGDYRTRVNFRRLGQARDRVFEVVVSDPVAWQLAAAYLDAEPGES